MDEGTRKSCCGRSKMTDPPVSVESDETLEGWITLLFEEVLTGRVLGSDGIWDCLEHHKCSQFVFYPNCINALKTLEGGAQRVCQSFLEQIKKISKDIFGSSSDNMSMSLVYIQKK